MKGLPQRLWLFVRRDCSEEAGSRLLNELQHSVSVRLSPFQSSYKKWMLLRHLSLWVGGSRQMPTPGCCLPDCAMACKHGHALVVLSRPVSCRSGATATLPGLMARLESPPRPA